MPLLAGFLAALFGNLLGGLAKDGARKGVTLVAAVASFAVALAVIMAAFRAAVAPLLAQVFQTQYGQFIGLAFPPVAGNCMASYVACWLACATYRAHIRITQTTAAS